MFGMKRRLEIAPDQLEAIENALHTQSKILSVQASAGGRDARARLETVKGALSAIAAQKPAVQDARPCVFRSTFFGQATPAE